MINIGLSARYVDIILTMIIVILEFHYNADWIDLPHTPTAASRCPVYVKSK